MYECATTYKSNISFSFTSRSLASSVGTSPPFDFQCKSSQDDLPRHILQYQCTYVYECYDYVCSFLLLD